MSKIGKILFWLSDSLYDAGILELLSGKKRKQSNRDQQGSTRVVEKNPGRLDPQKLRFFFK